MDRKKPRIKPVIIVFVLLILTGLLLITCGYQSIKATLDSLTPDGSLELFTVEVYFCIRVICALIVILLLAVSTWLIINPDSCEAFFKKHFRSILSLPHRFALDCKAFWTDCRQFLTNSKSDLIALLLIITVGIAIRMMLINRPILHDEAYSIVTWGSGTLKYAISDYHLPNNHIFHTILINLIYHTLGDSPILMRLPAFIAGILLIPSVYVLARKLSDNTTGILAAGLTSAAPFLVDYSVNARGYTLLTLFTVWTFSLAIYVTEKKNLCAWLWLILFAVLSFYTLPITLYPFGSLCMWIFLCVVLNRFGQSYPSRWNLFKYLIVSGLSVVFWVFICYLPVFLESGWNSVFNNVFVLPVPSDIFKETMVSRIIDNFNTMTYGVPVFIWILIIFGNLTALVFHRKIFHGQVSIQAAILIWMVPVVLYQKPNLWPRTMIWLLPLLIIWGSAGIVFLLQQLLRIFSKNDHSTVLYVLITIILFSAILPQLFSAVKNRQTTGLHEQAVLLTQRDDPQQIVFITAPDDNAALWYYANYYGMPKEFFDKKLPFTIVYVYVNKNNPSEEGWNTLEDVLLGFGPGNNFILMDTAEILMDDPNGTLYRFSANTNAVLKSYGSLP